MSDIRCGCGRRCAESDAVCLFCGRDPRAAAAGPSLARKALTAGGLLMAASAIVAAPVLLAACGCGGCGASPATDGGVVRGDAGPDQGDAGPIFQQ